VLPRNGLAPSPLSEIGAGGEGWGEGPALAGMLLWDRIKEHYPCARTASFARAAPHPNSLPAGERELYPSTEPMAA